MISIRNAVSEYEQLTKLVTNAGDVLVRTLDAQGQYVVETEAGAVERFRANLSNISDQVRTAMDRHDESALSSLSASIRGAFRDYRDRASAYLQRLRHDLSQATETLHDLVLSFQSNGTEAEDKLQNEIAGLQGLQTESDIAAIHHHLRQTTERLEQCIEQIRNEKIAITAQLMSEIRTLQHSLEEAHRAATLDETGVLKQDEFERLLRREIVAGRQIGVIHIWLRNLHGIIESVPDPVISELLSAFCKRARNVVPPEALFGRWRSDIFCIALPQPLMRSVAARLAKSCIGSYVCMDNGSARTVILHGPVTSFSIDADADVAAVVRKLHQLQPGV